MRINPISNQVFASKYLFLTKKTDIDTVYSNLCDVYEVNKNKEKKNPLDKVLIYKDKTDGSILVLTGYDAVEFEKNRVACEKSGYDIHLYLYDQYAQDAMRIDLNKQAKTR